LTLKGAPSLKAHLRETVVAKLSGRSGLGRNFLQERGKEGEKQ
jgi:hypothetical protein